MRYQDKVQKLTTDVDRMAPDEYTIILPDFAMKPDDSATIKYLYRSEASGEQLENPDYRVTPTNNVTKRRFKDE